MTIEQVRTAHAAEPFRAFVLHLADGRELAVRQHEFMAAAPSGRTIVIYQPDDSLNVVDLPLVTGLEFKASASGGRKRPKR